MKLILDHMSSKYGAPMGRRSTLPADVNEPVKLQLQKMRMVDGDYDQGGAYWGGGSPDVMWCAFGESSDVQVQVFVRGKNRDEAKQAVKDEVPNVKFYR